MLYQCRDLSEDDLGVSVCVCVCMCVHNKTFIEKYIIGEYIIIRAVYTV